MAHTRVSRVIRAILAVTLIGAFATQLMPAQPVSADATLVHMFASGSATGGKRVHLRILISEPAPQGGINIPLSSSDPAIPVPDYAHVNTGATEEIVGITTVPVTDTHDVTVTATYKGISKQKSITIIEPYHSSLSLQSRIRAGGLGKVVVRLSGRAPAGGITVNLSTNRPDVFQLPTTAFIAEGDASKILRVPATDDQVGDTNISATSLYPKLGDTFTKNAIVRHYSSTPPPTATATNTAVPTATNTAVPTATATSTPDPNNPTFSFSVTSGQPVVSEGTVVLEVCMVSGPNAPYDINFITSSQLRATVSSGTPHTYATIGECSSVEMTDLTGQPSGNVRLVARLGNVIVGESENINFPGDPETPTPTATSTLGSAGEPDVPTATNTPEPTVTNTPEVTP